MNGFQSLGDVPGHGGFSVDVSDRPLASRQGYWSQALQRGYYNFDVSTVPDFTEGRFDVFNVGSLRIGKLESDATRVHRRPAHVRDDGDNSFVIQIPGSTPLWLTQGRNTRFVAPGAFGMVAAADEYIYEQRGHSSVVTLKIPAPMLAARFPMVGDYINAPTSAEDATSRLFVDFVHSFCRHAPLMDSSSAGTLIQHLIELLALSLTGGQEEASGSAVHAAHRRKALTLLERQFRSADLRISDIAQQMRVSERYLQKIFAEVDQSLATVLRERRLAEAQRLLTRPGQGGLSITQIAYDAGFADSSYFCRAFKKELGMSPSDFVRLGGA